MRSRRGLSVLALCGIVLGVMAISASGAQAGMWMVNKSNVGTGVKLVVSAAIELEGGSLTLLSTSGANGVAITCTTATVANAMVELEVISGTINFSGCITKINGVLNEGCKPISQPIAWGGTIKAVLHEFKDKDEKETLLKLPYAVAEGVSGIFATFKFNEETCIALSPTIKVTGKVWLEDCNKEFEVEKVTHLVQEAKVPATALGGVLYGGNKMTLDFSANVRLIDEVHKGMTFSGLAE